MANYGTYKFMGIKYTWTNIENSRREADTTIWRYRRQGKEAILRSDKKTGKYNIYVKQ
jgi:hypothetical protein